MTSMLRELREMWLELRDPHAVENFSKQRDSNEPFLKAVKSELSAFFCQAPLETISALCRNTDHWFPEQSLPTTLEFKDGLKAAVSKWMRTAKKHPVRFRFARLHLLSVVRQWPTPALSKRMKVSKK
jgi:hypothetical protein